MRAQESPGEPGRAQETTQKTPKGRQKDPTIQRPKKRKSAAKMCVGAPYGGALLSSQDAQAQISSTQPDTQGRRRTKRNQLQNPNEKLCFAICGFRFATFCSPRTRIKRKKACVFVCFSTHRWSPLGPKAAIRKIRKKGSLARGGPARPKEPKSNPRSRQMRPKTKNGKTPNAGKQSTRAPKITANQKRKFRDFSVAAECRETKR
jgi:hypothetical protein